MKRKEERKTREYLKGFRDGREDVLKVYEKILKIMKDKNHARRIGL